MGVAFAGVRGHRVRRQQRTKAGLFESSFSVGEREGERGREREREIEGERER